MILDSLIDRFRRLLALQVALVSGVRLLAGWCLVWGCVVVILRAGVGHAGNGGFLGLVGVLMVLVLALRTGWQGRPPRTAVRALIDQHNHQGGLVMASGEAELGKWQDQVGELSLPRLRVQPSWGLLAAGVGFVMAAMWMPAVVADLETTRSLEIGDEVAQLAQRLETLADEGLLEEDQATRFENALQQLVDEASGDDPASAWATLDHLQDLVDRTAEAVAENALAEGEQLAIAEALAEALSAAEAADGLATGSSATESSPADGKQLAEAVAELASLTARSAAESRLLERSAADAMASAAGAGASEMLAALGRGKGSLNAKLDRLQAGGAMDLAELLSARDALGRGSESLARFLAENGLEASQAFVPGGSMRPGRGGVDRGRGDAPMRWQEGSSSDGARFREQILEAGSMAQLGPNRLIGLSAADPMRPLSRLPASAEGAGSGTAEAVPGATEGTAVTQTLLPRHRGAVRRYFDRPAGPKPSTEAP